MDLRTDLLYEIIVTVSDFKGSETKIIDADPDLEEHLSDIKNIEGVPNSPGVYSCKIHKEGDKFNVIKSLMIVPLLDKEHIHHMRYYSHTK